MYHDTASLPNYCNDQQRQWCAQSYGGNGTMAGAGIGAGGNGHARSPAEKLWGYLLGHFPSQTQPLLKAVGAPSFPVRF